MNYISAINFTKKQKPEIIYLEKANPACNQLGIKIIASSLCNHSEMRSFFGNSEPGYGFSYPMKPGEPGHEAVGVVTEKGCFTDEFNIGDIVVMTGHGGDECHRSFVIKESGCVAKIFPHDRNPAHAAMLEMFGCAYHCTKVLLKDADYENKKVAIIGLGAIGLCALQLLKLWPIKSLTAIDVSQDKLDISFKMQADRNILIHPEMSTSEIKNITGEFDVVIECSGSANGHLLAYELGVQSIIFASYCPVPVTVKQSDLFNKNTTIYNPGILTTADLKAVATLYNKKLIDPAPMISKMISPDIEKYIETIYEIKSGKIIKALIDWRKL